MAVAFVLAFSIVILFFGKPKAQENAKKTAKDSVAPETKDTKKPSSSVAQTNVGSASVKAKEGGPKKARDGKK